MQFEQDSTNWTYGRASRPGRLADDLSIPITDRTPVPATPRAPFERLFGARREFTVTCYRQMELGCRVPSRQQFVTRTWNAALRGMRKRSRFPPGLILAVLGLTDLRTCRISLVDWMSAGSSLVGRASRLVREVDHVFRPCGPQHGWSSRRLLHSEQGSTFQAI